MTTTTTDTTPEPFLRWAGGKRQLLPVLLPSLPSDLDLTANRFFEPFMGGAAVTWALSSHPASARLRPVRRKRGLPIVLNDVNVELADTYRAIKDDVEALITTLTSLASNTSESAYYAVRDSAPSTLIDRAARTIYLNRLSFNGLYRVRADGKFNVPYGQVARDNVCDSDLLRACSRWLGHAEIRDGSYTSALEDAKAGDVVYLDPPYIPLNATSSFSKYAKDDFREVDQWALAGAIKGLTDRGVRVLFSNSDTPLTRHIFGSVLELRTVSAARSIAASGGSRGRVNEVIGTNYDIAVCADQTRLAALPLISSPTSLPVAATTLLTAVATSGTPSDGSAA